LLLKGQRNWVRIVPFFDYPTEIRKVIYTTNAIESGGALLLPMRSIAEKFAVLYWPQTAPYASSSDTTYGSILYQNYGKQAAVIGHLQALRNKAATLPQARQHPDWGRTVSVIARVVGEMPVRYLQNLGGATVPFLYEPKIVDGTLCLLPGASFHLRRFHGFIQHLTRAKWVEHVRTNSRNRSIVGPAADLEGFMFGVSWAGLASVSTAFRTIQDDRCFFCEERLGSAVAVDHSIPWSRYPRDTALNFVLAHARCNADKRELLAAARM
jgi:5-methylcytosine-specific restriction endonuclease McrA